MDDLKIKIAELHLSKSDTVMRRMIKNTQPISLQRTKPSPFHALIQTIINQQLSIKAAQTIEQRVLGKQGSRVFTAEKLFKLDDNSLKECGLSRNKIRYVKTLATAVINKELNFKKLTAQDDDAIRQHLLSYPGLGPWSVDIFLMNGLGREDVFPIGDLIIRKSIQHHYSIPDDAHHYEYFAIAENWRPYRSIASYYLWKAFHQR